MLKLKKYCHLKYKLTIFVLCNQTASNSDSNITTIAFCAILSTDNFFIFRHSSVIIYLSRHIGYNDKKIPESFSQDFRTLFT